MGLSWITTKEDWNSNNGLKFTDTNRIENNIDYIRNQDATFLGIKTFGSNIIQVAGTSSFQSTSINGTLSIIGSSATSGFLDITGYVLTLGRLNFDNYINSKGTIVFNTDSNTGLSDSNLVLNKDRSSVFTGNSGSIGVSSTGYELGFTRAFTNYFNATSVGGNFAFNTNGNTGLAAPNLQLLQSGNNIFGAGADNGDFIQAGLDLDKSFSFGRAKIGFIPGESDRVFMSHVDHFTVTNAGLNFSNSGGLALNAASTQNVTIRNANIPSITVTGNLANFDVAINPTTTSTLSSFSLTTTPQLIPRGIYSIVHSIGATIGSLIEMQTTPGVWVDVSKGYTALQTNGDIIFSDGVNFRISVNSGAQTVSYRKF